MQIKNNVQHLVDVMVEVGSGNRAKGVIAVCCLKNRTGIQQSF